MSNLCDLTENFMRKKSEKIKIENWKFIFSKFSYNLPTVSNFQVRSPSHVGRDAKSLFYPLKFAQSLTFSRRSSHTYLINTYRYLLTSWYLPVLTYSLSKFLTYLARKFDLDAMLGLFTNRTYSRFQTLLFTYLNSTYLHKQSPSNYVNSTTIRVQYLPTYVNTLLT